MKLKTLLAVSVVFCALAFAQAPAKDRMVVVISLDGLPAYALGDPSLPVPTLRQLMQTGATGRMLTVNPTVTWPNHTAMVTGVRADEHGLLANGTIQPGVDGLGVEVEPRLEKEKMVHVPTVYDAAYRAGLTTAQVDWVAIHKAPTITWAFSEWGTEDGVLQQEMIRKGAVTAAELKLFPDANILFRDQIWTTAVVHLIREHKPNLLLFHLLSLDSVHHEYGPKTLAGEAAMAFLDSSVRRVVDAVRDAGMSNRTTFVIVSDHGFKRYTKQIRPAAALAAQGLASSAQVMSEGGCAYVFLEKSRAAELAPKVKKALAGLEGIDRVVGPEGFAALGLPQPDRDPQMAQFFLTAKDGYEFSEAKGGPVTAAVPEQAGAHGYAATDPDMDAIFIASGYGVRAGTRLGKIANIDVAPTLAGLLGVALPTARGKALPLE